MKGRTQETPVHRVLVPLRDTIRLIVMLEMQEAKVELGEGRGGRRRATQAAGGPRSQRVADAPVTYESLRHRKRSLRHRYRILM